MKKTNPDPKSTENSNYHHGDLAAVLLNAAERELVEKGETSFSLRAVAKRAGVSHGAPAHHFKDKTGLMTALASIGYERLVVAQNQRQKATKATPKAQLIAAGLGYIDFAELHPALFRLMFSSQQPNRADDAFSEVSMAAFNKLILEIKNYVGSDPYSDPTAMMQVMKSWSIVHGLAELIISGRAEVPINFSNLSRVKKDQVIIEVVKSALQTSTKKSEEI